MTQIKPTIGRVVWFYPSGHREGSLPHAAMIAYVHSDTLVNLGALDPNGRSYSETSVTLIQEGDAVPDGGRYATWMPFQIGQAKQTEISGPAEPVFTDPVAVDVDSIERAPTNPAVVDTAAKADGAETTTEAGGDSDGDANPDSSDADQETQHTGE